MNAILIFLFGVDNKYSYVLNYLPCRVLEYSIRYSPEYRYSSSNKKLDSQFRTALPPWKISITFLCYLRVTALFYVRLFTWL